MDELLPIVFSMPTLPWTCLVIASVVYWLTVILGALDLDVLGGADAKAHGLGDAGHSGHADLGHGDAGHAHGDAGHDHGEVGLGDGAAAKEGVLAVLLSVLKLRSVPVTILLSFLGLYGWLISYLLSRHVAPGLPMPALASHAIVLATTFLLSLLASSASIRPLAPLFRARQGTQHKELVGKVVRITTGRVDGKFGEAHLDDGGAGLQLQVRCADPDRLARDDEALILGWDAKTESFEVEPMSAIDGKAQKPGRSRATPGKPS